MTHFVVRYHWIIILLAIILAGGCSPDTGQSPPITAETSAQTCPSLVQTAMSAVDVNCSGTSRNQVCYGNIQLSAVPQSGVADFQFNAPGDIVDLNNLKTLQLSSMDANSGEWGVALMRVQADIPDSLPGQNVTILLFGNVEFEAAPPSDDATVANSFYFRTGIGDSPCEEAPESGILVQTPEGVRTVRLRMNEVDIELGSTAYLQAPENADMAVNVVEGQAAVTAQGVTRRVSAGTRTQIPLDANRRPAGPPSVPQVYQAARLQSLPLSSLQRQIDIANQLLAATFTDNAEDWTVSPGAGNLQQSPADDTADGYICAQSPAGGEPWYFVSPPAWRGDYTAAYGGALYAILRAESSPADAPDVRLAGGGLTLANRLPYPVETTWTGYRLALTTSAGWTDTSTNQPATAEQIRVVLAGLETISIPGGQGQTCLDSVHLTSAVQPLIVRPTPVVRQSTATPYVEVAGRVPIDLTVSDSLDQPGQQKTYTFEAAPGQTVYFDAQDGTFYMRWAVTDSAGTVIFDGGRMATDPGQFTLTQGGTYTVTVFGDQDTVGAYQFKVWDVPPPQEFTFAIGNTVAQDQPGAGAGNIESPGSQDIYTFAATAGQTLYFDAQGGSFYLRWSVVDSAGTVIFDGGRMATDPGQFTLTQGGTYTLVVKGDEDAVGTYQFKVWDVPPPQEFTFAIGDTVVQDQPGAGAGNIESPGSQDIYTFAVTAGQPVYFDAQGGSFYLRWSVVDSAGTAIFDGGRMATDPGQFTLTQGGTYTLVVKGDEDAVGTYQFKVWDVPPPQEFTFAIGDTVAQDQPGAGAGNIESPGSQDIYTFAATAGQPVYFDAQNGSFYLRWSVVDSAGTVIFDGGRMATDPGQFTLTQGGQYTLVVKGDEDAVGTYQFKVWDVPPPQEFTFAIGDTVAQDQPGAGAGNIESPGSQDIYTFAATAGQDVTFDAQDGSFYLRWSVMDSAGTITAENGRMTDQPLTLTLERGGTYTLTVYGDEDAVGTYGFRIMQQK